MLARLNKACSTVSYVQAFGFDEDLNLNETL